MSLQDHHLIEVIGKSKPAKLAISVFTGSSDWEKSCEHLQRRLDQAFGFKYCEVFFYDSQSDECWVKIVLLKKLCSDAAEFQQHPLTNLDAAYFNPCRNP